MSALSKSQPALHRLAARLSAAIEGEVLFDRFSRGRYATDASFYQIEPLGIVIPKREDDLDAIIEIAREEGVPVLARGGGTSQSGQTVGRALVVDFSKHLNRVLEVDAATRTCTVEPGIVLDALNAEIAKTGLWFPVDVSTKARATIGGMAGNNSCGTRSIRYGVMRDNTLAIEAILADGQRMRFGAVDADGLPSPLRRGVGGGGMPHRQSATFTPHPGPPPQGGREKNAPGGEGAGIFQSLLALGRRETEHLTDAFPRTARRVGGYNLDALVPGNNAVNLATLLVGSEGTLALSRRLTLSLAPQPRHKALGVCHFPTFRRAMEATQHIVKLGPVAVEVVDRTLIELARDIAMFRPVMDAFVRGKPDALLLTEFAEDDEAENVRRLARLEELMGDLGLPGAVVKVTDGAQQRSLWEVREAGLNIMMSMKSDGKPVSFIEDCAVPLEHLADYTERLTAVFEKHGTRGTWYAHASVGCLHVRPVLNLKLDQDVRKMRAIAEEAFAMVREYKGAHSGEHGDGLVRSEFHTAMYGEKTVRLFEEVKDRFDPAGLMNPGKIVRPPKFDDRSLFRYKPDYRVSELKTALDWSGYSGAGGGFQGAVEMCNNNGACRKIDAGVMCPSYRVTRDEKDVTRGRANSLRLAMSGQLGHGALASDDMLETMKLCVSCKGCRRECPTGVDMARMKIEVLAAARARRGLSLHDRLVAYLPRYAPWAARVPWLMNLRDRVPGAAWLSERLAGFAAARRLPRWAGQPYPISLVGVPPLPSPPPQGGREQSEFAADSSPPPCGEGMGVGGIAASTKGTVALLADTFNTYFEPENLAAAARVLGQLGYGVALLEPVGGGRPLCCGRTFLSAGLVEEARIEARRLLAAIAALPPATPVVGLEPSCLLTLRDEYTAMRLGEAAMGAAGRALLFEEFLSGELAAGRIQGPVGRLKATLHLHGHCHQKAFDQMGHVQKALGLIEGLKVIPITSSCCGMAGSFGHKAETYEVSMRMAEASLLPAVRAARANDLIAADGFSCRHQICDGAGRHAVHVARILDAAVANQGAPRD